MSTFFINLTNEFNFFNESFISDSSYFINNNFSHFFFLNDFQYHSFLDINTLSFHYTKLIVSFINQTNDLNLQNNLENITSVYHYSIPNTKLAYPEPFIASPSFMHSDLWFVHILVYQYWLWFVFVFIIIFFFIMFICTIRWCNMRIKPRRETRGVSRSKCGDLITACVPVTWAASIIVNESTDAIDYYDGFGTTELVVGIRAYQWGWEYYYPKDIDLNYNIKTNYSSFIGNSLKYEQTTDLNLKANNFWKFYQNKTHDQVITPAYLLTTPLDNNKLINFLNFQDLGSSPIQEINAFKKVKMFSKTITHNLIFNVNNYTSKYKNFSNLYLNDNSFLDSHLYGLKRQHNFLTSKALFNNQNTFFDLYSINKLINFNLNFSDRHVSNTFIFNNLNFFKKITNLTHLNHSLRLFPLINDYLNNSSLNSYSNFINFSKALSSINDDTDKKNIKYPLFKLFNLKLKTKIIKYQNYFNTNNGSDFNLNPKLNEITNFFNKNNSYKTLAVFSSNQAISSANKYNRNLTQIPATGSILNYSIYLNPINDFITSSKHSTGLDEIVFFKNSNLNWINLNTVQKIPTNKLFFDYPYSPIISNHCTINSINYDDLSNSFSNETPTVLQGKEELMPAFLPNAYWNFYWSGSTINWRLKNIETYNLFSNLHYFPLFTLYYDYDFRNWQSIELLEDSFWESSYSLYSHDEYLNICNDFYEYPSLNKVSSFFNKSNKLIKNSPKTSEKPLFLNNTNTGYFYSNAFYVDDIVTNPGLLTLKDFSIFQIYNINSCIEDSYDAFKYLNYFYTINNNIFLNLNSNYVSFYNSFFIFDTFRSDYDEFSWFVDEIKTSFSSNSQFLNLINELNYNIINEKTLLFFDNNLITDSKSNRFSNFINLRAPVKASIVTYNAIQKVFRTRFDENRSNTKLNDFGLFFNKQSFINAPRVQYEKILGKNKETFYNVNFYKNNFNAFFNSNYEISSSLNYYFFDFPFLLALKSDASRYLWFDWFAKWGFYEVQPSSSSRYAIYGMPYLNKNLEFSTANGEMLNESETYLLRISRARKNYLPNWTYTPYFYSKHVIWYKNNVFYEILNNYSNSLTSTRYLLSLMSWYWNVTSLFNCNIPQFSPSISGISNYVKLGWKPQNSIQSYYYNISTLIDILTKREYLYREILSLNNKIISLPLPLTSAPNNPLVDEIKSSFLFTDPVLTNNEFSKEIYYNSLNFFNTIVLKNFLENFNKIVNVSPLLNYIFYYFLNTDFNNNTTLNELYKSQFKPLRKGITNMIRLHATGAIAMPIEIRLQVLASSKDVIHSWAIPSAGIKIDCVPGYSSHKVMIFLVSGIFWGQCMEICGRYHHWMPIVVYFMKRDLFFLWCTHFVFLSGSNNMWNINDRQYTDYIKLVSFDKYSWIEELN